MSFSKTASALLLVILLVSCAPAAETPVVFPTYDPFVASNGSPLPPNSSPSIATPGITETVTPLPTATRPPTPTRVPLSISALFGFQNQASSSSPTPDTAKVLPTPRQDADQYIVQPGDTLGSIAQQYNISLQSLLDANNISDANSLEVGVTLLIPAVAPIGSGSALKIIPDSELVHGPAATDFNLRN
ncbi:MAG: hypothetical protein RIR73_2095, partial [Chloroflexota bacterium]